MDKTVSNIVHKFLYLPEFIKDLFYINTFYKYLNK